MPGGEQRGVRESCRRRWHLHWVLEAEGMQVAGPSSRGRLRTKGGETWVLQRGRVPPSLGVERLECQMEQAGEPGLLQRAVGAQCEFRGPDHDQEGWLDCPGPPLPDGLAGTPPPHNTHALALARGGKRPEVARSRTAWTWVTLGQWC